MTLLDLVRDVANGKTPNGYVRVTRADFIGVWPEKKRRDWRGFLWPFILVPWPMWLAFTFLLLYFATGETLYRGYR